MHLQVETESVGSATVVDVIGELDLHTAPDLDAALTSAAEQDAADVVVDLSRVDFMDSTGLSVIVSAVASARDRGATISVVTASEKITKVFTLTGVDQQVAMYATREEALAG
jgi:anti-sigma B factor antagonist